MENIKIFKIKDFEISDEELSKQLETIKVIEKFHNYFFVIPYDKEVFSLENAKNSSYRWEQAETPYPAEIMNDSICITMYSEYGYGGLFKPSLAEIIAQIPKEWGEKVDYFMINANAAFIADEKYHAFQVTLFQK